MLIGFELSVSHHLLRGDGACIYLGGKLTEDDNGIVTYYSGPLSPARSSTHFTSSHLTSIQLNSSQSRQVGIVSTTSIQFNSTQPISTRLISVPLSSLTSFSGRTQSADTRHTVYNNRNAWIVFNNTKVWQCNVGINDWGERYD